MTASILPKIHGAEERKRGAGKWVDNWVTQQFSCSFLFWLAEFRQSSYPFMWADMAKRDVDSLELFKLKESHKTARWLIVGCVLVFAVWIIADAAVKISTQPDRWVWIKIAATIAAAFIPAGALMYRWVGKLKMQIRRHADRVTSLELSVDVNRESSGANQDGTHRYDDL